MLGVLDFQHTSEDPNPEVILRFREIKSTSDIQALATQLNCFSYCSGDDEADSATEIVRIADIKLATEIGARYNDDLASTLSMIRHYEQCKSRLGDVLEAYNCQALAKHLQEHLAIFKVSLLDKSNRTMVVKAIDCSFSGKERKWFTIWALFRPIVSLPMAALFLTVCPHE